MTDNTKSSTVTLPGYTMVQLRCISSKRKKDKNLAWSHENIIIELINKESKKIIKGEE